MGGTLDNSSVDLQPLQLATIPRQPEWNIGVGPLVPVEVQKAIGNPEEEEQVYLRMVVQVQRLG